MRANIHLKDNPQILKYPLFYKDING